MGLKRCTVALSESHFVWLKRHTVALSESHFVGLKRCTGTLNESQTGFVHTNIFKYLFCPFFPFSCCDHCCCVLWFNTLIPIIIKITWLYSLCFLLMYERGNKEVTIFFLLSYKMHSFVTFGQSVYKFPIFPHRSLVHAQDCYNIV